MMYSIGGIYRHPNGNVSHFVSALELLLNDLDNGRTTIIAGDMNIDIIKHRRNILHDNDDGI